MKTDRYWKKKYLRVDLLLCLLFAVVSLLIAISEFRATARFADMLHLNTILTEEDSFDAKIIDSYAEKADEVIGLNECRSDIIRSGMAFVMRDLDLQDPNNRYDAWASATDRANRFVLHSLACNPADGDMWVRLALVTQSIGENPQQLSDLMRQSVLLSPAEMHTIRARFMVWKKATNATLSLSDDAVGHDLRTLLNYGKAGDIRDILGTATPDMRTVRLGLPNSDINPYILAAEQLLPPQRTAFLIASGIIITSSEN
ncbi:hypothetical protein ACQZ4Y_19985 [Rhizobium sp. L80/93]|uniref:hypothetical protein n=1 Tax=unclassified Rhizobium TaxID=2613769 RepID=UPI001ADA7D24|nr:MULTISPECIES: hypothetical protein [unclassified Rhizobium]MBO9136779.1 hypothetical protein [Rhizobium sp. B209b/85]MBO9188000.1 hypothetical protein [Rhizobium sp. E27B/91]QXZ99077.1 hypothetical protein J5289_21520 [Rhizobium sp. B230/85]